MSIVSLTFSKINAEKSKAIQGKVNVVNNIAIKNVDKANFIIGKVQQDSLRFSFEFTSKTEPSIGSIVIEGDVIYMAEPDSVEKVMSDWKEKKPISKEIITPVINGILKKCNIEALILSQTMNLPAPIKLPSVSAAEATDNLSTKAEE